MPPAIRGSGGLQCAGARRDAEIPASPTPTNNSRIAILIATTMRSVRATVVALATFRAANATRATVRDRCFHSPWSAGGKKLAV